MRVLLIANSQGTAAGVEPGESYPEIARALLAGRIDLVPAAESGWTVDTFLGDADRLTAAGADVAFCQLGIVECACRILSVREKELLARVPGSSRFTKLLHDHRPGVVTWRRRLGISTRVMSPAAFRARCTELKERLEAAGTQVVFIETPHFSPAFEAEHFPFVNEDIALFNDAIRDLGTVLLCEQAEVPDELWQAGTVHLNQAGHRVAARCLADRILAFSQAAAGEPAHA